MPETYKSIGTALGTTASTTIYSGTTGYAIVNAINVSNTNINTTVYATVNLVKGATAYSIITGASVPGRSSLQVLDSPVVLNSNDTITALAGATGSLHTIVSVLEVT